MIPRGVTLDQEYLLKFDLDFNDLSDLEVAVTYANGYKQIVKTLNSGLSITGERSITAHYFADETIKFFDDEVLEIQIRWRHKNGYENKSKILTVKTDRFLFKKVIGGGE